MTVKRRSYCSLPIYSFSSIILLAEVTSVLWVKIVKSDWKFHDRINRSSGNLLNMQTYMCWHDVSEEVRNRRFVKNNYSELEELSFDKRWILLNCIMSWHCDVRNFPFACKMLSEQNMCTSVGLSASIFSYKLRQHSGFERSRLIISLESLIVSVICCQKTSYSPVKFVSQFHFFPDRAKVEWWIDWLLDISMRIARFTRKTTAASSRTV